jgi:vacuolar-type H+-ATPase subunit H
MKEEQREPHAAGALGSVRQLEGALEATVSTRSASDTRVADARAEAARLLHAARGDAAAAVAERRRVVLAAAEDDAAAIRRRGEDAAARVRADAQGSRGAAVEAALAFVLPDGDESEA